MPQVTVPAQVRAKFVRVEDRLYFRKIVNSCTTPYDESSFRVQIIRGMIVYGNHRPGRRNYGLLLITYI